MTTPELDALLAYWDVIAANPLASWPTRQMAHRCACELRHVINGGAAPVHHVKHVCRNCGRIEDVDVALCTNQNCVGHFSNYASWALLCVQENLYNDKDIYPAMPTDADMFTLPWAGR